MGPAQMAAGAPPQMGQQTPSMGQAPSGVGNIQSTPGQAQVADPSKIKEALKAVLSQTIDQQGFVDLNKVVILWPQIAQQMGINIPFQTVFQMIQQDPSLIEDIINQMGIAGIIINGKQISAEQLLAQSQSGNSAATGSPAQVGAAAQGA